jgi:integrase
MRNNSENGRKTARIAPDGSLVRIGRFLTLPKGIKRIVSPQGFVSFEARAGVVNKKKLRRRFSVADYGSEEAAIEAAKNWLKEMRNEINTDRASVLKIDPSFRFEIMAALALLEPRGYTLVQAVEAGVTELDKQRARNERLLADAVAEFLEVKKLEKCKDNYMKTLETALGVLMRAYPKARVSDITPAAITNVLRGRQITAVTWNNWRRDLGVFFSFAMEPQNRWIAYNPAKQVRAQKVDVEEVEVLDNKQVKELFKAAVAYKEGRQVPWLALGLFGGLRRDEADAAQWEDVDFENNTLRVRAAKARSAGNRYVHMEPVLKAWLLKSKPENASGPIGTGKFARRDDLAELSETTGLELNKNFYRHTYGSNHLWQPNGSKQSTMLMMGHTSAKTFDGYYNNPRPKMIALAYWELTPESVLSV